MAMTKIIDPRGWDFDRPIVQMIKVSSRGLIGSDRSNFIKTAGDVAPAFLGVLDQIKLAKDEVPIHTIALGATEFYGPNRNGDGFKEAGCRKHHHTFEKFARWYRNHANKDPKISYGVIKKSAFNEPMKRVELLAFLNAEKSAAERNGGFVADKELEKLAKGEDIPTSMACRVPFDVCAGCDNKARTRAEYCTSQTCKYGGCKDNLTKVADDGFVLHVDNPDPVWFDESHVFRPADRIAYGAKAEWLDKAASHGFLPGNVMAEALGVTAPLSVILGQDEPMHWSEAILGQLKLARALAIAEQDVRLLQPQTYRSLDPRITEALTDFHIDAFGRPGTEKAAAAMAALADMKVILPIGQFARWINKQASVPATARLLPGVYTMLIERGGLEDALIRNPFAASFTKTASNMQRTVANTLMRDYSLNAFDIRERAMRSSLRSLETPTPISGYWNEKQAGDDPDAAALAEQYALYKLAALHRIASFDRDFHLTARLAIGQNRVV